MFFVFLVLLSNFGHSQIKVNSSGTVNVGPNTSYSDYTLNILGFGSAGSGGFLSFGDNNLTTKNILLGEAYGTDSDKLLLHAKYGILFSTSSTYNYKMFLKDNGYLGINTTSPDKALDINGGGFRLNWEFSSSLSPFEISVYGTDPKILADRSIVFYKTNYSGYIDIKCQSVIESSDSTLKRDIKSLENSLQKVSKLSGVQYRWKGDRYNMDQAGLLAQDVQKYIPEVIVENDSTGELSIKYTQLIPYLIESIKEQQEQIDVLNMEIASLKSNSNLKSVTSTLEGEKVRDFLHQNIPNPFNENTEIKYFIPEESQRAILFVFNMQGEMIKQSELFDTGEGSYMLNGSELQPGMYIYSLVIDDKEMSSKRMILTK